MLHRGHHVLRILVVDDIQSSREGLCAQARELGHEAVGVAGGVQALQAIGQSLPDVVLLDLLMPGLDGFGLLPRMRAEFGGRWVPVISLSSLQGDAHVIEALACGADDHLFRPVSDALLRAKLDHYGRVLALQARLGALAQRQRDIHDNIADPVITVDDRSRIVEANLAACRDFGLQGPLAPPGTDLQTVLGVDLPALLSGQRIELRLADGRTFLAEVSASQWRGDAGPCVTAVVRDLTERLRNERMRDEFLATVSHELRTPLTSVLGAMALLASGAAGPLPAAALPLAEAAQRNGTRLSRLIDDVLDLTKLEGDRMEMHLRPQPIWPLLEEALAANQGYADKAGVALRLVCGTAAAAERAEARVDAERFLQVMANLLSNAIKHSPRGETVTVTFDRVGTLLKVAVADRGPGVSEAFRARLFEKFSQAEGGDSRVHGGTGLGLYITRLLVQRMGGRVGLEPGAGAIFSVALPVAGSAPVATVPCLVHVDVDADMRQRVAGWLAGMGELSSHAGTAGVAAGVPGPGVLVANPLGQGLADAFCADLRRLAAGRPVLLFSDSVDAEFAARHGFEWLSPARSGAAQLQAAVRSLLAGAPPRHGGLGHGAAQAATAAEPAASQGKGGKAR